MASDSMVALVRVLSEQYKFDADEAIRDLGLTDIQVIKKKRSSSPKEKKEKKEKKVKEVKPQRDVPTCVIPWTGAPVDRDWCQAIKYNHGLYNQCTKEQVVNGKFCKTCTSQCEKNDNSLPDFGSVEQRMACGLFEYKYGKAQKQCLPLANVMSKLGDVSKETIETEAARFGLKIPEEQWTLHVAKRGRPTKPDYEKNTEEPKEKKKRGRPATKKAKTQESAPADDLIASLVADAMKNTEPVAEEEVVEEPADDLIASLVADTMKNTETEPVADIEEENKEAPAKKNTKKQKMTDEEKESKKAKKEAQNAEKKAKKEAEKEAKNAQKEAEKEAKNAQKEAEKEAKKEAQIAEKKATEEKALKEAEEKALKEAEELKEEVYDAPTDSPSDSESEDEDQEPTKVRKFEHDGTTYLRDENTNILYNLESQDEVGIWNSETKSIDDIDEEDEEEEDEEE